MFWDERRGTFGDVDLANTSPLPTTLAEMQDKGFCELIMFLSNPRPYELTPHDWITAQRVAGRFDTDDFDTRRGRAPESVSVALSAALAP